MIHVLNPIPPNRNQKPNLCAPTCLQMILERRSIPYGFSLEDIALKLDLYIDQNDKDMFGSELQKRALKHGDARIGLLFESFKEEEKLALIKEHFGLEAKAYHPSEMGGMPGLKELLKNSFKQGRDVMFNFRLESFNGRTDGHYVLAFAYDDENNEVYVSDPSPFMQEYWKARLGRFEKAMRPIWKEDDNRPRERGVVVFDGPMNKEPNEPSEVGNLIEKVKPYVPVDARIRRRTPEPIPYHQKPTKNSEIIS